MGSFVTPLAEWSAAILEAMGITVIVVMALYAIVTAIVRAVGRSQMHAAYEHSRQILGRGILFGLEFLVAADIIHTVAVELTWRTVGVLAVIVLIRTFLSVTLDLELTGRWPWEKNRSEHLEES